MILHPGNGLFALSVVFLRLCSVLLADDDEFTNEWAAHIPGGVETADRVARELGYVNMGQIGNIEDHYRFIRDNHPTISKRGGFHHTTRLNNDDRVYWAEQQVVKKRQKRDFINKRDERRAYKTTVINDLYWPYQWYMRDTRRSFSEPRRDLNVLPVWQKGITGKNVVISVIDDGLEHTHPDLAANYEPRASLDLNSKNASDNDPAPRYEKSNENKHGTRCAGEIAMLSNNSICGVGVAYEAKIGAIRMLDGKVTDSLEGQALAHGADVIDIFSASWGPNDDGQTVEGPGKMALKGFKSGIQKGRKGKGIIYVWASGNGGGKGDNCDCDGYTGSIYTLSISSASQSMRSPWYAERCASTMASTHSSGKFGEQRIISTDLHHKCTRAHTGTSASAPLAAGVVALLLQFNPSLTWRDVQHLVAWTSSYEPLAANPGWKQNGAGFRVNSRFGFGLMDASALINAGDPELFRLVGPQQICTVHSNQTAADKFPRKIVTGEALELRIWTSGCRGQRTEVNYLEHLVVIVNMNYTNRGVLSIYSTSPAGTNTMLLNRRPSDSSRRGFHFWPFMSVHTWGENPGGYWTIRITDDASSRKQVYESNSGTVHGVTLELHGTREMPHHMRAAGGKRKYSSPLKIYPTKNKFLLKPKKKSINQNLLSKAILNLRQEVPYLTRYEEDRRKSTLKRRFIGEMSANQNPDGSRSSPIRSGVRNVVESQKDNDIINNKEVKRLMSDIVVPDPAYYSPSKRRGEVGDAYLFERNFGII